MEKELGITVKRDKDFSEWYTQVILKADLADYSPVKGCMIIKPNGYAIWENIVAYFNTRLKELKVRNAYFPLFIPESFFKKEAKHAKGFTPEVAWIANQEGERLAVRPTSETVMYDAYAKWIRSYRDLPLRINQFNNVVRWETKQTRLFLRTREFLWQEGHCVYATNEECEKETELYLKEYKKLAEDILAIPVLTGKKTESEKFAGAFYTLSMEALMPDGRALQMATSHNLGQGFAEAFGISFLGEDEQSHTPWQNSWGFSTRLIGALVMVHGDDKGLVLPPRIAPIKAVIIPILFGKNDDKVVAEAHTIAGTLQDIVVDDRSGYTAGWKFNEWELRGVPLRIEIGPKDIAAKQVVFVRRDTGKKEAVPMKEIKKHFEKTLDDIQKSLFQKAKKFLDARIVHAKSFNELKSNLADGSMALAEFCGSEQCEHEVKEATTATPRIIASEKKGKCVVCAKHSSMDVYFAKAY